MKLSNLLTCGAVLLGSATAFTVIPQPPCTAISSTRQYMFGGGGAGTPTEDDPEAQKAMEAAAAAMGMPLQEYQVGMRARVKLQEDLTAMRIQMGDAATVSIERDGNNPAQFLQVTITEKGKELGQETVSQELCAALKKASDASRLGRQEAQKNMMQFINEEMKKVQGIKGQ